MPPCARLWVNQAAGGPLPACDFCLPISPKGFVFDLIPSSWDQLSGNGLVLSFSGQNVFLQMKEFAFLYDFIILMGIEGTEVTFFSDHCSFPPPAPFATVADPSGGT